MREATAADHATTDAAFGGFDLGQPASYGAFLIAHARALPPIEVLLADDPTLPRFGPRAGMLHDDLAALGLDCPPPLAIDPPRSTGAAHGMLYVIEGSRLGGAMLARTVGPGLPRAYLAATHPPGGWRAFGAALDAAAQAGGPEWLDHAIAGAHAAFAHYRQAAELTLRDRSDR